MSACRLVDRLRRVCVAALLASLVVGAARGDEAQARVRELFDAREFGQALSACNGIQDPTLRAEWRFHVLFNGGDLFGALDAALDGLAAAPGHAGLSHNALICAYSLRSAEIAAKVRAQLATTPADLAPDLDRLAELERSATRRTQLAKGTALAILLASVIAMVALSLRSNGAGR